MGMIKSGLLDKTFSRLVMGKAWQVISLQERQEIIEIISEENKTASWIVWYHLSRSVETSKEFGEEAKVIQAPVLYLWGEHSIM